MDTSRMMITSGEKSMSCGWIIFSTESLKSSKPMITIITDTNRPDRYSSLPCPKGCSGSGSADDNLKPSRVITEDPASDKLLKASAVIAIEWLNNPAKNLLIKMECKLNVNPIIC